MKPIRTPHWAPAGTHPTERGWVTQTGEVIKKQKFTAEQIAHWHGNNALPKQTLHEAPVVETVIAPEVEAFHYDEPEVAEVEETEEDK